MKGLDTAETVVTYKNTERPEHRKNKEIIWSHCRKFFK